MASEFDDDEDFNKMYTFTSPLRQNFSLPPDTMKYIIKNPNFTYRKLIQTCKYFFAKNSIVFFRHIMFSGSYRNALCVCYYRMKHLFLYEEKEKPFWSKSGKRCQCFNKVTCKFWADESFIFQSISMLTLILPKLYHCHEIESFVRDLPFQQLPLIAKVNGLKIVSLKSVKYLDGSEVPAEAIVELFPNIESFT